ncbi:unnamed protein product [Oppiella nova]|uniref:Uncharacterized protein n=1 Tax=Oppiella nova TaxID=334625 RepID=A0A7R9LTN5_9ACAR|nr:unnamed protein product [Oppiella nova]CAG2166875.1 unnamed protein product [Oppiella nova]
MSEDQPLFSEFSDQLIPIDITIGLNILLEDQLLNINHFYANNYDNTLCALSMPFGRKSTQIIVKMSSLLCRNTRQCLYYYPIGVRTTQTMAETKNKQKLKKFSIYRWVSS